MEQFGMQDAIVPRLNIVHKEVKFKDSLAPDTLFDVLDCIVLGLVKQRLLWFHKITNEANVKPMCQAPFFSLGVPNVSEDTPRDRRFPWELTAFNPADYPPQSDGNIHLPCEACSLKEWGSHPAGDKPYCQETWTLPIMRHYGDGVFSPAIISFAKSGLGPLKSFFTVFLQRNAAPFEKLTRITLKEHSMGGNTYSKPVFSIGEETDRNEWRTYAVQYGQMKGFIERMPGQTSYDDEYEDRGVSDAQSIINDQTQVVDPWDTPDPFATAASPPPVATPPAPPAMPVQQPVAAPPTAQQPVAVPPVQQPISTPQTATQPVAPPPPQAPVAQPLVAPPPQAPVAQQPVAVTAPADDDDDDLPF